MFGTEIDLLEVNYLSSVISFLVSSRLVIPLRYVLEHIVI